MATSKIRLTANEKAQRVERRREYKTKWAKRYRDALKKGDYAGFYLVGNRSLGWFKIGCARTVRLRVQGISNLVPFAFDVVRTWKCYAPRNPKGFLLMVFKDKLVTNEWFCLTEADIESVDSLLKSRYSRLPIGTPVRML